MLSMLSRIIGDNPELERIEQPSIFLEHRSEVIRFLFDARVQ